MDKTAGTATANRIHNNKYSYDAVPDVFKTTDIVTITCPIHGNFDQRWSNHIAKSGCSACGKESKINKLRKSVTYFKHVCAAVHSNRYDYSHWSSDTSRHSTVTIICPIHGDFKQRLNSHMNGHGCKLCAVDENAQRHRKGVDYYIKQSHKVHNNQYDYSLWAPNLKTTDKVSIICSKHGTFTQSLNSHLMGRGCYKCKPEKFKITCKDRYGTDHIKQKNIPLSVLSKINDINWLIEQHVNLKKPLSQIADSLNLSPSTVGSRFKNHNVGVQHYFRSAAEQEIVDEIIKISPEINVITNARSIIPSELDIYLPDYKIAIEYDGLYWHSEHHKCIDYHLKKTEMCEAAGIRLIHIFQDEWKFNKNQCLETITHLLNKSESGIYARNAHISEIPWAQAKAFLNKYHLLGAGHSGNYRIGAFDKNNTLVGVMVFGAQNNESSDPSAIELRRFVTDKRNHPGLGSKMFKYAITTKQYTNVIAFVDRRWFTGLVKTYIGFTLVGTTKPSVWWTNGDKRFHRRFKTKKSLLLSHSAFDTSMSKVHMLKELGFYRIYDCGKLKLEWNKIAGNNTDINKHK